MTPQQPLMGLMQGRPLLISSIIEFAQRYHGNTEVVSRRSEGDIHRTTWRRISERSKQVARTLDDIGFEVSARVATLAWNGYRHLELYYGVSGSGRVLHTINPRLVRNDGSWGKKPQVQNVTFKILTNDATRVAALLSNDVQAIDTVPVNDLQRLASTPDLTVLKRAAVRFIDAARDLSPFVTDKDGKPLPRNPLKDARVRLAIAKAIDRDLIRARVMEGAPFPTVQILLPGLPGHIERLKPEPVDVEGAKKLLAEAGYPNGFGITLHGMNNRYVQDQQILQALAQMFSRIGIATKVEAMPASAFFPCNTRNEFSLSMSGWAAETGELAGTLRPLVATRNPDKGNGTVDANGYSNAKVDQLIDKAMATLDDAERDNVLKEAAAIALGEQAIIPLHNQLNVWAMRKNIRFAGRADERTHVYGFVVQH